MENDRAYYPFNEQFGSRYCPPELIEKLERAGKVHFNEEQRQQLQHLVIGFVFTKENAEKRIPRARLTPHLRKIRKHAEALSGLLAGSSELHLEAIKRLGFEHGQKAMLPILDKLIRAAVLAADGETGHPFIARWWKALESSRRGRPQEEAERYLYPRLFKLFRAASGGSKAYWNPYIDRANYEKGDYDGAFLRMVIVLFKAIGQPADRMALGKQILRILK